MIRTYSRFPYRKSYGYLLLALAVLLMSWEGQRADAAIAGGDIPQESIRLRILANSDSAADQAIKRQVRDAVVAEIDQWVGGPQTIADARLTIRSHMGDIDRVISRELNRLGVSYGFKAELGIVPFPTKMYGSKVYPAGDYEALRVSLGEAKGQNWWCVLFPPLCFVDAVSGEATASATTAATAGVARDEAAQGAAAKNGQAADAGGKTEKSGDQTEKGGKQAVKGEAAAKDGQAADGSAQHDSGAKQPQVKFFLWELIKSFIQFIKNLFS